MAINGMSGEILREEFLAPLGPRLHSLAPCMCLRPR
jgi:plasmid maintenance system antidote protein VapI